MPEPTLEKHSPQPENPYLNNPGWHILLQKHLIIESGIDKFEWIRKYAAKFRGLIEEHQEEIKELIKDPILLQETFKKWLYEEKEETIH